MINSSISNGEKLKYRPINRWLKVLIDSFVRWGRGVTPQSVAPRFGSGPDIKMEKEAPKRLRCRRFQKEAS